MKKQIKYMIVALALISSVPTIAITAETNALVGEITTFAAMPEITIPEIDATKLAEIKSNLTTKLDAIQTEAKTKQTELETELTAEKNKLTAEVEAKKASLVAEMEKEKTTAENELKNDTLEKRIAKVKVDAESFVEEAKKIAAKVEPLKTEVEPLKKEGETLKTEGEKIKESVDEIKKEIDGKTKEEQAAYIAKNEEEIEKTIDDALNTYDEIEKFIDKAKITNSKIQELKPEITEMMNKKEYFEKEISEIETEVDSSLEKAKKKIESLKTTIDDKKIETETFIDTKKYETVKLVDSKIEEIETFTTDKKADVNVALETAKTELKAEIRKATKTKLKIELKEVAKAKLQISNPTFTPEQLETALAADSSLSDAAIEAKLVEMKIDEKIAVKVNEKLDPEVTVINTVIDGVKDKLDETVTNVKETLETNATDAKTALGIQVESAKKIIDDKVKEADKLVEAKKAEIKKYKDKLPKELPILEKVDEINAKIKEVEALLSKYAPYIEQLKELKAKFGGDVKKQFEALLELAARSFVYKDTTIIEHFDDNFYFDLNFGINENMKNKEHDIRLMALGGLQTGVSIPVEINGTKVRFGTFAEYQHQRTENISLGLSMKTSGVSTFVRYRLASLLFKKFNHNVDVYLGYEKEIMAMPRFAITPRIGVLGTYSSKVKLIDGYVLKDRFAGNVDLALELAYKRDKYKVYFTPAIKTGYNDQKLNDKVLKNSYLDYSFALGGKERFNSGLTVNGEFKLEGDMNKNLGFKLNAGVGYNW